VVGASVAMWYSLSAFSLGTPCPFGDHGRPYFLELDQEISEDSFRSGIRSYSHLCSRSLTSLLWERLTYESASILREQFYTAMAAREIILSLSRLLDAYDRQSYEVALAFQGWCCLGLEGLSDSHDNQLALDRFRHEYPLAMDLLEKVETAWETCIPLMKKLFESGAEIRDIPRELLMRRRRARFYFSMIREELGVRYEPMEEDEEYIPEVNMVEDLVHGLLDPFDVYMEGLVTDEEDSYFGAMDVVSSGQVPCMHIFLLRRACREGVWSGNPTEIANFVPHFIPA